MRKDCHDEYVDSLVPVQVMRTFKSYSWSHFQVSHITMHSKDNYRHRVVHYTSGMYSKKKGTFVPLDQYLPISGAPQPLATTVPLSVSDF